MREEVKDWLGRVFKTAAMYATGWVLLLYFFPGDVTVAVAYLFGAVIGSITESMFKEGGRRE